jgi:ankyrin repeat protein
MIGVRSLDADMTAKKWSSRMTKVKSFAGCVAFTLHLLVLVSFVGAGENLNSEFRVAAGLGQLERVQVLLKQGAEIDSRAPSAGNVPAGGTALMLAAARDHIEVVKFLISKGANVNLADEGGGTALIYTVWKGNKEIVALLLEKGADIYARTRDGRTPLSVAKQYGHTDIEQMLKAAAKK